MGQVGSTDLQDYAVVVIGYNTKFGFALCEGATKPIARPYRLTPLAACCLAFNRLNVKSLACVVYWL